MNKLIIEWLTNEFKRILEKIMIKERERYLKERRQQEQMLII